MPYLFFIITVKANSHALWCKKIVYTMLLRTHTHADQEPVYIIRSPLAAQYSCKQHKTHLQRCVLVAFNKTACKWRYKKHIVIEQSLGRPLHTGSERSNKFSVAILFSPSAANLPHWTQYAAMAVSTLSNVIFGHGYRIFINTAKQLTTCIINCKKNNFIDSMYMELFVYAEH